VSNVGLRWLGVLAALAMASTSNLNSAEDWRTPAERSNFQATPRYAETKAYFERLQAHSKDAKLIEFGTSPEGRSQFAFVLASNGEFTPELARASGKPVLLIQACIHPGENEGKDALMALSRDWLTLDSQRAERDKVVLLLIPIFSVDGHERFGPHNRINQNGPAAVGWRNTAQNLNLNRDFLKAEAPEMQAWLRQFNAWDPALLVDMHNTNGADYQYDLLYAFDTHASVHPATRAWLERVLGDQVIAATEQKGWLLGPYFDLQVAGDLQRGIKVGPSTPRFSSGFGAAVNRPALLLETHMLKDLKTRIKVNEDYLRALLKLIAADPDALQSANRTADQAAAQKAGTRFGLSFKLDPNSSETFAFKGFRYTRRLSEISGALWTQYSTIKETWPIELKRGTQLETDVELPHAYLLPASWQVAIDKLALHGVEMTRLSAPLTLQEARTYRFSDVIYAAAPFEGRVRIAKLKATESLETLSFPSGSVLVQINQRRAPLIAHLLEPSGPDSLVRMGYGDGFMVRGEYAEERVLEAKARELLKASPALQAQFEAELAKPEFAGSAAARLDFFYRRLPHYDSHYLRYPVARLNADQLKQLLQASSAPK